MRAREDTHRIGMRKLFFFLPPGVLLSKNILILNNLEPYKIFDLSDFYRGFITYTELIKSLNLLTIPPSILNFPDIGVELRTSTF